MKRDMYVIATADPEGTMQRNVFYESFLQDDVDRSSSVLLTPVNIFLHGAGLLSTFFLNSVALDLASLAANYRGGRDDRAFVEPYVASIFRSDDNSS